MFIPVITAVLYLIYKFRHNTHIITPYHSLPEIEMEDSFMHFYNYNLYEAYYANDVGINYINYTHMFCDTEKKESTEPWLEDIPIFIFDPIAYPF
jgi:hypothetical protein